MAAEAGKHILCEKPLALNAAECAEMEAAAARAGVAAGAAALRTFLEQALPRPDVTLVMPVDQAEELFAQILEMGHGSMLDGVIQGIDDNWFQGRIADSAFELERRFNAGERIVVGVNGFSRGLSLGSSEELKIAWRE